MKAGKRIETLAKWASGKLNRTAYLNSTQELNPLEFIHRASRDIVAVRDPDRQIVLFRASPLEGHIQINVGKMLTEAQAGRIERGRHVYDPTTKSWKFQRENYSFDGADVEVIKAPPTLFHLLNLGYDLNADTVEKATDHEWFLLQDLIKSKFRFHAKGKPVAPDEQPDSDWSSRKSDSKLNHISFFSRWILDNHSRWLGNLNSLRDKYDLDLLAEWQDNHGNPLEINNELLTLATS